MYAIRSYYAYQRDFCMMEKGKCKTKFPTFDEWYATLNYEQKARVENALLEHFYPRFGE